MPLHVPDNIIQELSEVFFAGEIAVIFFQRGEKGKDMRWMRNGNGWVCIQNNPEEIRPGPLRSNNKYWGRIHSLSGATRSCGFISRLL
jgi:hypothetical protein